ncbi:HlyD family secretion protein [Mucilaginibacter daejeonensis]|uniref:HlyD family efflux transporter periplasmic adaptor subunit n=1 Tax=Mucilaginibacter daejeonensis TaxID=398049 RepID=UPI001D171358|nr:HlyD family efflux transporter periplasmic adaptor subunit [Mucilaginibacter daejeonensis]UEG51472.1 HlyD family secretion protein [Mucilaginibacter daejeonensis]
MPIWNNSSDRQDRHSEEVQDIIGAESPWLLRWGIMIYAGVLIMLLVLATRIQFPEVVKTQLKIISADAPKAVVTKLTAKLNTLLVHENQMVMSGQPLGYLESTANHNDVLSLLARLYKLKSSTLSEVDLAVFLGGTRDRNFSVGEIQNAYQTFTQSLIDYESMLHSGIYQKRKAYIQMSLSNISQRRQELTLQKHLAERDLKLAHDEYQMNQKLNDDGAETKAELRAAESRYILKQNPLIQTNATILTLENDYAGKEKEMLELENEARDEKQKFLQALNSLISAAEDWKSKYLLTASQSGKVSFAGIIQQNQVLHASQEVFYINPGNADYFGEMYVPHDNIGKIKVEQTVLIRLKGYPFEEYGQLVGKISTISDVPYKDSIFLSKVQLINSNVSDSHKPISLKQGMLADAQIITEKASVFQRIYRNILRVTQDQ